MKKIATIAAAVAATLGCSQALATYNGHPINNATYYRIDVQPITTMKINFQTGAVDAHIAAYYLAPNIPLPPPPVSIADPLMINGYIIQAANDQAAAGIYGAWVSGQMTLQQLQGMAKGTVHEQCMDVGGAPPTLTFKVTDNPNEAAALAALCTQVANFNGEHIALQGLVNSYAWEGNYQSCWSQPPYPVPSELSITGGTGHYNKVRGELEVRAVQIVNPQNGQCMRPGPVKKLKFVLIPQ